MEGSIIIKCIHATVIEKYGVQILWSLFAADNSIVIDADVSNDFTRTNPQNIYSRSVLRILKLLVATNKKKHC